MKKILWLLTLVAAPAAFAQQTTPAAAAKALAFKAHVLSRGELDALLKKPEKLLLIDVRRPDEVASIGGFPVYLSVQMDTLGSDLSWIPKDRLIVTVSNHAARAGKAADTLTTKGFKVAGAVGAEFYARDGGTLTKVAPPPAAANAVNTPVNASPQHLPSTARTVSSRRAAPKGRGAIGEVLPARHCSGETAADAAIVMPSS